MEYRCSKCDTTKDETEFSPSQRKTGAWCRMCMRKKKGPHPSRPCECCGTVMEDPNPKARFCGPACKARKSMPPERTCEQCRTTFQPQRITARFCGRDCKDRHRKDQMIEVRRLRSLGRACAVCGGVLDGRRADAKWCSEACAQKRATRKIVARRANLKSKYGITEDEYERLLKQQHGKCAICQGLDPFQRESVWAIDHDHITGQVRGLLCSKCNTGIGQLRDDPDIIAAAARYIRRHRQMVLPI